MAEGDRKFRRLKYSQVQGATMPDDRPPQDPTPDETLPEESRLLDEVEEFQPEPL